MRELDIGILLANARHHVAPELRGLEYVGLVDRADLAASRPGGAERDVADALDLRLAVAHGVEAFALGVRADPHAARLAEVDVTGELAQDHQIEALDHLALERRGTDQLRKEERGPEIGEQAELLAQAQQTGAGPHCVGDGFVARHARGAEQDRVSLTRDLQRRGRQGIPSSINAGRADRRLGQLHGHVRADDGLQHLDGLRRHFRADAVAGKNGYLHALPIPAAPRRRS
jgi:hypothetical protein